MSPGFGRVWRIALGALVAAGCLACAGVAGAAQTYQRLHWRTLHLIATEGTIASDGRYVLLAADGVHPSPVLDTQTNRHFTVASPAIGGCSGPVIGAGQLLTTCQPGQDQPVSGWVYTLASRRWVQLPGDFEDVFYSQQAVGRNWAEFSPTSLETVFINLHTGERLVNPTQVGAPDLDAPATPFGGICRPLPRAEFSGWLTSTLAVMQTLNGSEPLFLQRCGSTHRQLLAYGNYVPDAGGDWLIWSASDPVLYGYNVRLRQVFHFSPPPGGIDPDQVAVAGGQVFVVNAPDGGPVLAATLPRTKPPSVPRGPRITRVRWHGTGTNGGVLSDGRYLLEVPTTGAAVVWDLRSGRQRALPAPPVTSDSCYPAAMGAALIADVCQPVDGPPGDSLWIFGIATRTWTAGSAGAARLIDNQLQPVAVGTQWIAVQDDDDADPADITYVNWHSGAARRAGSAPADFDLNRATPTSPPPCRGLNVADFQQFLSPTEALMDFLWPGPSLNDTLYVQNCRTGTAEAIAHGTAGTVGSGDLLIWESVTAYDRDDTPTHFTGYDLRTHRGFALNPPPGPGIFPRQIVGRCLIAYDADTQLEYWAELPANL